MIAYTNDENYHITSDKCSGAELEFRLKGGALNGGGGVLISCNDSALIEAS